jgi:transposase
MTGMNGVVQAGANAAVGLPMPADPEVIERPHRRQFTAGYKLQILQEADACDAPGQLGALLRREGLYSSHLRDWRRQRTQGTLNALAPRRRGRPPTPTHEVELARLRHENDRLSRQLAAAEAIVEIQKKVSALLALTQPTDDSDGRR